MTLDCHALFATVGVMSVKKYRRSLNLIFQLARTEAAQTSGPAGGAGVGLGVGLGVGFVAGFVGLGVGFVAGFVGLGVGFVGGCFAEHMSCLTTSKKSPLPVFAQVPVLHSRSPIIFMVPFTSRLLPITTK